jgi:hypothetical protein
MSSGRSRASGKASDAVLEDSITSDRYNTVPPSHPSKIPHIGFCCGESREMTGGEEERFDQP